LASRRVPFLVRVRILRRLERRWDYVVAARVPERIGTALKPHTIG
jgi:hypothetical protein